MPLTPAQLGVQEAAFVLALGWWFIADYRHEVERRIDQLERETLAQQEAQLRRRVDEARTYLEWLRSRADTLLAERVRERIQHDAAAVRAQRARAVRVVDHQHLHRPGRRGLERAQAGAAVAGVAATGGGGDAIALGQAGRQ